MMDKQVLLGYVKELCDWFDWEYKEESDGTFTMWNCDVKETYNTVEDMLKSWKDTIEMSNESVESDDCKIFTDVLEVIKKL